MPSNSQSDWRIVPLLIVLPWTAVFIVYQTGVLKRAVQYLDQAYAARDPDRHSFLTRASLEQFHAGNCDLGLFFLEGVEMGEPHGPSWVRGIAIECLEAASRDDEARLLLDSHCSSISRTGDSIPAFRVNPEYPRSAIADEVEGWVVLQFGVTDDGRVSRVEVLASDPPARFDRTALDAVSRWRYCPGAASSNLQVRLVFELAD
jgi:TonB family protein